MDLAPDFSEFFDSLIAQRVEFVVVGAYALALHGAPRYTGDLDILVHPSAENIERTIEAIRSFGFPVESLTVERLIAPSALVEMGTPPVQIHVMTTIDGVSWDDVWLDRQMAMLGRHLVAFIGRETFVRNKRAAGRAKDLADLDALGG